MKVLLRIYCYTLCKLRRFEPPVLTKSYISNPLLCCLPVILHSRISTFLPMNWGINLVNHIDLCVKICSSPKKNFDSSSIRSLCLNLYYVFRILREVVMVNQKEGFLIKLYLEISTRGTQTRYNKKTRLEEPTLHVQVR